MPKIAIVPASVSVSVIGSYRCFACFLNRTGSKSLSLAAAVGWRCPVDVLPLTSPLHDEVALLGLSLCSWLEYLCSSPFGASRSCGRLFSRRRHCRLLELFLRHRKRNSEGSVAGATSSANPSCESFQFVRTCQSLMRASAMCCLWSRVPLFSSHF